MFSPLLGVLRVALSGKRSETAKVSKKTVKMYRFVKISPQLSMLGVVKSRVESSAKVQSLPGWTFRQNGELPI